MVEEMGSGNKLQRQQKGLWSLGKREKSKGNVTGGKWGMGKQGHTPPKGEQTGSSVLRAFRVGTLEEVPGEDFNRTFISFPVCPFKVKVSTDWLVPEQVISQCSWS